jgi:hypothetical protein
MHTPGLRELWSSASGYPTDVCEHTEGYSPSAEIDEYPGSWTKWRADNPLHPTPDDTMPVGEKFKTYTAIVNQLEHRLAQRRRTAHQYRRRVQVPLPVSGVVVIEEELTGDVAPEVPSESEFPSASPPVAAESAAVASGAAATAGEAAAEGAGTSSAMEE